LWSRAVRGILCPRITRSSRTQRFRAPAWDRDRGRAVSRSAGPVFRNDARSGRCVARDSGRCGTVKAPAERVERENLVSLFEPPSPVRVHAMRREVRVHIHGRRPPLPSARSANDNPLLELRGSLLERHPFQLAVTHVRKVRPQARKQSVGPVFRNDPPMGVEFG